MSEANKTKKNIHIQEHYNKVLGIHNKINIERQRKEAEPHNGYTQPAKY